jgi:hypothetical protein
MFEIMKKSFLFSSMILILLALAVGCGKRAAKVEAGRGMVSGTVSLDGKLLGGGMITFTSVKDSNYSVALMIRTDGTFLVDNAPVGDVLVAVETESAKVLNPKGYVPIPAKYTKVETSGLKATIDPNAKEGLKIELKSKE